MNLEDLRGKKVAVAGLGINNQKLADYLQQQKITFEIFDGWQSADALVGKLDEFEVIFRTPGLPYLSEAIQRAKTKGVIIYSQTKLFFDMCPAKIIGVTGTKGKGTTATLLSKILEAGGRKTWLAGNIGEDPFEFIDEVKPDDLVVLELSSFQLQDLHKSPHLAVVLKITADHLDHHRTVEEYIEAKKNIVAYQTSKDFAVINYDNEVSRSFASQIESAVYWNSINQKVSPGCFVENSQIVLAPDVPVMSVSEVALIGRFNLENVPSAIAAASALGVADLPAIRRAVSAFHGLPHRLEFVAELDGVRYFDDSFSTVPDTAIAAIDAFSDPIVLIAGGSEKKSDYGPLGRKIAASKVKALLPIGATGQKIVQEARKSGFAGVVAQDTMPNMKTIVETAKSLAISGDVVLLSPAAASFGMFKNYKDRGDQFKKILTSHGDH